MPTPPVRAVTQRAARRWLGLATLRRRDSRLSNPGRSPSPQAGALDAHGDAPTQTAASTARGYVDLTPLVQAAVVELRTHTTLDVRDRPLPIRGSSLALRRALDTLFVTLDRAESTGIEA